MSSHHEHDHHATESKPVAFRTPLILGLVTVLFILLLVSTCDGGHHGKCECKEDCSEECMKKCEEGDHSGHHDAAKEEHHEDAHAVVADTTAHVAVDSAAVAHDTTKVHTPAAEANGAHH